MCNKVFSALCAMPRGLAQDAPFETSPCGMQERSALSGHPLPALRAVLPLKGEGCFRLCGLRPGFRVPRYEVVHPPIA